MFTPPFDLIAVSALAVLVGFLAWRLDREVKSNDTCSAQWVQMFEALELAQERNDKLEETALAFSAFQRQVEAQGSTDIEVQRLRAANGHLADYLADLEGRVMGYKAGLLDARHDDEAAAFQKWLDGDHDSIIH